LSQSQLVACCLHPSHITTTNIPQPKTYLDFIATYERLMADKRRENAETTARLTGAALLHL
jgi:hypothetical protein